MFGREKVLALTFLQPLSSPIRGVGTALSLAPDVSCKAENSSQSAQQALATKPDD